VSNFVDHAGHLLFVDEDIAGFLDVSSVDSGKGNDGSLGTTGHVAGHGVSNPTERLGSFTLDDQEEVSTNTGPEDGRSRVTADAAGTVGQFSTDWILVLQSIAEVIKNRREKIVFKVVSESRRHGAQHTVVTVHSKLVVAGKGSAFVVSI
jgi:hypothetical protein